MNRKNYKEIPYVVYFQLRFSNQKKKTGVNINKQNRVGVEEEGTSIVALSE